MHHSRSRPTRRDLLLLAGAACAGLARPAAAQAPAIIGTARPTSTMAGQAFGTTWRVAAPSGSDAEPLRDRIVAILQRIDRRLSPWRPDSEVARFNRGPAGARTVSPETAVVARAALAVAEASDGSFDPTVGPLVARWGFGPIAGAAGRWRGLVAGETELSKAGTGLTFDPCGIAKGHALDCVAAALEDAGRRDFLADLGGEYIARGRHPSGRAWRIGVEDPRPEASGMAAVLRLDDRAVATSGTRRQGYTLSGRRYSHIIDPAKSVPVDGRLLSVSAVAATAMEADAWATALMAAGAEGPDSARARMIPALFLFHDGAGLHEVATGGFAALRV